MGEWWCAVAAVHDGYLLRKTIVRAPLGGKLLNQCMLQSVESKGVVVKPSYSFKRHLASSGQWEVGLFQSFATVHIGPFPVAQLKCTEVRDAG
jgi:hypothetical protein